MNERDIFDAALAISDNQKRAAFLDQACGENETQRREVEEMLDAQERLGSFLQGPPAGLEVTIDSPILEKPGTQIGPYKLLQRIGEGGFGVVYMAEQHKPVRRKVALKIIKPGMDTKDVIARFEAERQALALMDHPNIAKVFDAGATDKGRPYFVMELIKGKPLTEYCDQNKLSTRDRLDLFVTICHAVQHAHQKGIIHRDLKPSNVMVTLHDGKPVPKIIDFGVSKALSQQLTEKTLFTSYGQMVGTPQYMSPEQAEMSGLDIDTRSDVYSLGVLLYELLTGTTPLDGGQLRKAGYAEIQRLIREVEPQKPSTRLSTMGGDLTMVAEHRSADAKHLGQIMRGDLDWIVMKSLSKERERRYGSASGFADDVVRYLADQPIDARPPSAVYRWKKWVRRNKAAAAITSAVAVGVIVGVAGLSLGLIEANRRKLLAEEQKRRAVEGETKEKEAREKLQETTTELDQANRRLAAEGARLALEKGMSLVSSGNAQQGLLWLARALEQSPDEETTLERRIRVKFSSVARALPVPVRVFAPEDRERFDQIKVSRKRDKLLAAVSGATEEVRVWSLLDGELIGKVPLDRPVSWCDFSESGKEILVAVRGKLQRYDLNSGTAIGSPHVLPTGAEVIAVRPDGKQAIITLNRQGMQACELLDLTFPERRLLARNTVLRPRYTPDGKWVILGWYGRNPERSPSNLKLRRHRAIDGERDEEWSIGGIRSDIPIVFSADGATVLAGMKRVPSSDREEVAAGMGFFDFESGELKHHFADDSAFATSGSLNGPFAVTMSLRVGGEGVVSAWDTVSGDRVLGPIKLEGAAFSWGVKPQLEFVADETSIVVTHAQTAVQWRLPEVASPASEQLRLAGSRSRSPASRFRASGAGVVGESEIVHVVTTPDLKEASLSSVFQARRHDLRRPSSTTSTLLAVLNAEQATISPDGKTFVAAGQACIQRWSLPSGQSMGAPIPSDQVNVVRLRVSGNGKVLMCQSQRYRRNWNDVARPIAYRWIGSHLGDSGDGVTVVKVYPDTPAGVAGLEVGDVLLYADGIPVRTIGGFIAQIGAAGPSAVPLIVRRDGQRLTLSVTPAVSPDAIMQEKIKLTNGRLNFYSMETGKRLNTLSVPIQGSSFREREAVAAAISPDGSLAATASHFGEEHYLLHLWDVSTGRPLRQARGLGLAKELKFSTDGKTLVIVCTQYTELWTVNPLARRGDRIRHPGVNLDAEFSDDNATLATYGGAGDASVCFWDVETTRQLGLPVNVPAGGFRSRLFRCPKNSGFILLREDGMAAIAVPGEWGGRKSEAMDAAIAMVGCRLDPDLGMDRLQPLEWQRRLAPGELLGLDENQQIVISKRTAWQEDLDTISSTVDNRDLETAQQRLQEVMSRAPIPVIRGWLEDEICRVSQQPGHERLSWYCRQLLSQDPEDYLAHQMQVLTALSEGDFDAAEKSFRAAVEHGPRDLLIEQFFVCVAQAEHERTLRFPRRRIPSCVQPLADSDTCEEWLLDRILEFKPSHVRSRLLRMVLSVRTGRIDKAERDLAELGLSTKDAAREVRVRDFVDSLLGRYGVNRTRVAAMVYQQLTELAPDNIDHWVRLAHCYGRIREWDDTEKALRKLIELGHTDSLPYLQVAAILAAQPDKFAYRQWCKEARERLSTADTLAQFRSYEMALLAPDAVDDPRQLLAGIREHQDVGRFWYEVGLGLALCRAGRPKEAIPVLKSAMGAEGIQSPGMMRAQLGLALAYYKAEAHENAAEEFERARRAYVAYLEPRSTDDLGSQWANVRMVEVLMDEVGGLLGRNATEDVSSEERDPRRRFAAHDADGDGAVTKDEAAQQYWDLIKQFDVDGDDAVERDELESGLREQSLASRRRLFAAADRNKDGRLNSEELGGLWEKYKGFDSDGDDHLNQDEFHKATEPKHEDGEPQSR